MASPNNFYSPSRGVAERVVNCCPPETHVTSHTPVVANDYYGKRTNLQSPDLDGPALLQMNRIKQPGDF